MARSSRVAEESAVLPPERTVVKRFLFTARAGAALTTNVVCPQTEMLAVSNGK